MRQLVRSFEELGAGPSSAGGKGATLARLHQAGYPVPDGFVIPPGAFDGDTLTPQAWIEVQGHLARLRVADDGVAFAVRSSALSEDSAQASFAGEFETVLDVRTDEEVRAAINTVRASRASDRVRAYSQAMTLAAHGLDAGHDMAVVVQRLVRAVISGVLFTADPVTGSYQHMVGNYVHGLGEGLVSGEAEPHTFTLSRPRGKYDGPDDLKRHARVLSRLGKRLERDLGGPQDIEWAIAGGKLYLLQSRPVTTLQEVDPVTGEWNSSRAGDFFWTNVNAAEARPDVMTPFTWSLGDVIRSANQPMPGNYPWVGSIAGRFYVNLSITVSMMRAMGMSPKRTIKRMENAFGPIPEGMDVPLFPFPLSALLATFPKLRGILRKEREAAKRLPEWIESNPTWCRTTLRRIDAIETPAELVAFWHDEVLPAYLGCALMVGGSFRPYMKLVGKLRPALTKLVGGADASALLSNLSDESELMASMGPVVGVSKVARGEMGRLEYLELYGHRGPHEMELAAPRPAEDPGWLDRLLEEYERAPVDVDGLMASRRAEFEDAWRRFQESHPRQARSMRPRLEKVPAAARLRESFRSEMVRAYGVVRAWVVRAGELTGLGDDVFFLTHDELFDILAGAGAPSEQMAARKATYERQQALPQPPSIIRGRFDPYQWAAGADRRNDIFDAHAPVPLSTSRTLSGYPGAAGRVEGRVRRLDRFEEGDQLQPGEVLVTAMTNVGWTPIFPRAAAVVTDVGAPLSHAAIVARELGIPAVVGCIDATTRLRTGDRVRVDGGQGVVEILEESNGE
jgi:phosphohistidine swiveling domain-containing protein